MNIAMNEFNAFAEGQLGNNLEIIKKQIVEKIRTEKEDYILNVNEKNYTQHLVSQFEIKPPELHFDKKWATESEANISSDRHPSGFILRSGSSYKRQVLTIHIPVTGDSTILRLKPNPAILWTYKLDEKNDDQGRRICFDIINFNNDKDAIEREINSIAGSLRTQLGHIINQLNGFNQELPDFINQTLQERKKNLMNKDEFLSSLTVPVKKKDPSNTFAIPVPSVPKKIYPKPTATKGSGKREPILGEEVYDQILELIHDVGKTTERAPSLYGGKDEEMLRDYFLSHLQPRFEGSATGETFNKSGRTDILLRYQNTNVFVAECKFWAGDKALLDALDQLLKYLTWRDSKTALLVFVKNKGFTEVKEKVKSIIPSHKNYVDFEEEVDETWLRYKLHLKDDKKRLVFLAVQLFHFPN